MADPPKAPKGKGSGLTKTWHGAPIWVWALGGSALAFGLYRVIKARQATTSTAAAAGVPLSPFGGGGGDFGGGGGGSGGGSGTTPGPLPIQSLPVGGLSSGSTPDTFLPAGSTVAPTPGPNVYPPSGDIFAIGPAIGPSPTGYDVPSPGAYGSPGWSQFINNANAVAQANNAAAPESQWAVNAGLPPPGSPPVRVNSSGVPVA